MEDALIQLKTEYASDMNNKVRPIYGLKSKISWLKDGFSPNDDKKSIRTDGIPIDSWVS